MAKYEGTYSCGHEGVVDVIGPQKDRKWKVERYFSGLCPECYKKEQQRKIEEDRKIALEKTAEMELPALTGTEKQIAWANTIRISSIESFTKKIDDDKHLRLYCSNSDERIPRVTKEELTDLIDYIAKEYTSAKFWIESRTSFDNTAGDILLQLREQARKKVPDDVAEELEKEKEELTVTATDQKKSGIVVLSYNPARTKITAEYIRDDDFIKIVKDKTFAWNPTDKKWEKEITEYTGTATDRIAETGKALLEEGFTVQFPDQETKEHAISGKFDKQTYKWVKWKNGSFAISWRGRSDTYYGAAKKLPGAVWQDGSMRVKVEFYKEVSDFAENHKFRISAEAQKRIGEYTEKENKFERKGNT